jgi:hypothetical protein
VDVTLTARPDRRLTRRLREVEQHGVKRLRVRPGHEAALHDISAWSAAIETTYRLLPGASVELQIDCDRGRSCVRGRVLRCAVVGVEPHRLTYGGVICFDNPIGWLQYESAEYVVPIGAGREGTTYPSLADTDPSSQ